MGKNTFGSTACSAVKVSSNRFTSLGKKSQVNSHIWKSSETATKINPPLRSNQLALERNHCIVLGSFQLPCTFNQRWMPASERCTLAKKKHFFIAYFRIERKSKIKDQPKPRRCATIVGEGVCRRKSDSL